MDNIFPFLNEELEQYQSENNTGAELPMPKEYDWDYQIDCLKLNNGKPIIVEGKDAIKVWAYKALKTLRNAYNIHSEDYGNEIESIIGQGLSIDAAKIEAQRLLEECLLVNPYINAIENLEIDMADDLLTARFSLITRYGEVDLNV